MRFLRKFFDRKKNKYIIFNTYIFNIVLIKKNIKKTKKTVVSEANNRKI